MNSDTNTPLLNKYKFYYLCKVLPQTLLGGIKLRLGFNVPYFIYIFQILIWILPIIIGSLFTITAELSDFDNNLCGILSGITVFLVQALVHVVVLILKKKATAEKPKNNFLAEEDGSQFNSCFCLASLQFLVPNRSLLNYIFHPLLNGVICCFALLFLLPERTDKLFKSLAVKVIVYIFGWITVCTSCYPLIGQAPKEPAKFYSLELFELEVLTRPFYVILIILFDYFSRSDEQFDVANFSLHILFVFLPVLWTTGFLPPIDSLVLWGAEYTVKLILGGGTNATNTRLFVNFTLSWLAVLIVYFITHSTVQFCFIAALATLLTTDLASLVIKISNLIKIGPQKIKQNNQFTSSISNNVIRSGCVMIFTVVASVVITGVTKENISSFQSASSVDLLGFVLSGFVILYKLIWSSQQIYVFFGWVKNPLESIFPKKFKRMVAITLYAIKFFMLPLYLVFTLGVVIQGDKNVTFINILLVFRLYRMAWQNTLKNSYDIILYFVIRWLDSSLWQDVHPSVTLFIISFTLYGGITFFKNLWFIVILVVSSILSQKHQKRKVAISLLLSFCFLPLTLAVVLLSSILDAPLLPLFTLPIFAVGFPRPFRIWPYATYSNKSATTDWIYYQHLMPELTKELRLAVLASSVSAEPGSYYLARFQDRILWINFLESGLMYSNFVIKGLELQETSCHTTEAQFIDETFENSFSVVNNTFFNKSAFSVLLPKTELKLETYSDARNVLTGVIGHPDFLEKVSKNFPKILLWNLIRHCLHRRQKGLKDVESKHSLQDVNRDMLVQETTMTNYSAKTEKSVVLDGMVLPKAPIVQQQERFFHDSPGIDNAGFNNISMTGINNQNKKFQSNENDSDDEFGDFGFDSDDKSSSDSNNISTDSLDKVSFPGNVLNKANHSSAPTYQDVTNFSVSVASAILDPPTYWKGNLPYSEHELSSYSQIYTRDWYQEIITSLCLEDETLILEDSTLEKIYRLLVMNCYYLINVVGVTGNSVLKEGPGHVYRVFHGMLPWSPKISWIDNHDELKNLVIKSYRLSFKFAYDSEVYGETADDSEMVDALTKYDKDWYIGDDTSEQWTENVLDGTPNLLSLGQDKRTNMFTSRTLSKQKISVPIAEVNSQSVRGLWSALSLELYYMTNDDDERYSIQALPPMLRNIITQAADPPLGYPVFSSGLVTIPL